MKTISIVTPCYNEEENVEELYNRVRKIMLQIGRYRYEHVFIDNHSRDNTVPILKRIAARDHNVRIIVNTRNFGQVRSPIHGLSQARGDAVIGIAADFQEPPELIPQLIEKWEEGYYMVLCIKKTSREHPVMFWLRSLYYKTVQRISSVRTFQHLTGFGLYDRKVIDTVVSFKDPYPYFRGIIADISFPYYEIIFDQPRRARGITSQNFFTLYDLAMLGITNASKVPLRIVTFIGFISSVISIVTGLVYFIYKLLYWNSFTIGLPPLIIGLFFFGSVQMVSLGIIGEYVGAIHTHVQNRPWVIEQERVNFEYPPGEPLDDDAVTREDRPVSAQ